MDRKYEDIINLPHHVSSRHPHMPVEDRAAQFAPFAALTGHKEAVLETARLTDRKLELDADEAVFIDEKVRYLLSIINEHPGISVTHFVADEKKSGGMYITEKRVLLKFDEYTRELIFDDGGRIKLENIIEIESDSLN